jgi:hypothetical protein
MFKRLVALCLSVSLSAWTIVAAAAQDAEVTTPCNAHLATLADPDPHAYEAFFAWLKLPGVAERFVNEKLVNSVETIAIAPVSAREYNAIFKRSAQKETVTETQAAEIQDLQNALSVDLGRDHGDRDFDHDNFKRVLQSKSASFVIVIGHNENGRLRLLDGNDIYLDEVVAGARQNQRVILISCDSASELRDKRAAGTISGKISYATAVKTAAKITSFIHSAKGPLSLVDVQKFMSSDERSEMGHDIAFFIMKAACAGTAMILVALIISEFDPCKRKDNPKC